MIDNARHVSVSIIKSNIHSESNSQTDVVSVEEPLEISLVYPDDSGKKTEMNLSVTMRTPGDDTDLVLGFLFSEGIISSAEDFVDIEFFGPVTEPLNIQNQVRVELKSSETIADRDFQRYFYSNSSCGVCGKASIQALAMRHEPKLKKDGFYIAEDDLKSLPKRLRAEQSEFTQTGALHAVALVNNAGVVLLVKEDVGRHNAMDKMLGELLISKNHDTTENMVLVSGRSSFELVQKALMADIPLMASIGAPSSAAIDMATSYGMTLVGFLKESSYNIYNGRQRIKPN